MKAHNPRKRFGQNFLQDPHVIQKILDCLHLNDSDYVVEIGPGLGALTIPLLERIDHLEVVELDRELVQSLQTLQKRLQTEWQGKKNLIVHQADALKFDFSSIKNTQKLKIIGNLPYNISTPLLFHLFQYYKKIDSLYFMLQKEVVDRLVASSNCKQYGRLSIMAQYFCDIECLFTVDSSAFYPKPKVQSAFVRLIPHTKPLLPEKEFICLQNIVRIAFNSRRKTLSNALKAYLNSSDWQNLKIDPGARPENLSVSDFIGMSHYIVDRELQGTQNSQNSQNFQEPNS